MNLQFLPDTSVADWLISATANMSPEDLWRTLLCGPPGYESYARVLALPDPAYPDQPEAEIDEHVFDIYPDDFDLVRGAVEVLSTGQPEILSFLMWDGWPFRPEIPTSATVSIGDMRTCVVAQGTVDDWYAWATQTQEAAFAPSFVWPRDRSWCIAYDVDAHFLGAGGSQGAIDRLLTHPRFDVVRADRDVLPPIYG